MSDPIKTVLLLALPASGKSEVRRYLEHLPAETVRQDLRLGPTVQLDDFPYVHLMRCIDDALRSVGDSALFFGGADASLLDNRDWGTLIHLLNEDYDDLINQRRPVPTSAAEYFFHRLDAAAARAGIAPRLARLTGARHDRLLAQLEGQAREQLDARNAGFRDDVGGRTVIIEFARGGSDGAAMPLPPPMGYEYSLSQLSHDILADAGIVYIWVTPPESRRKNAARANPDDPGSILHHGVPEAVMRQDYGCDDIDWLEQRSGQPGFVQIQAHGRNYRLPIGRFDNRVDRTSFLRDPPADWPATSIAAVHHELRQALSRISGAAVLRGTL